jgi:hypothetical protein
MDDREPPLAFASFTPTGLNLHPALVIETAYEGEYGAVGRLVCQDTTLLVVLLAR